MEFSRLVMFAVVLVTAEAYSIHHGFNLRCGPNPGIADNIAVVSLQECITACDEVEACVGFVVNAHASSRCFFRAEEALASCQDQFGDINGMQQDDAYDVYIKEDMQDRIFEQLAARRSSKSSQVAEERREYLSKTLGAADSNPALTAKA
eukprot:TRINITY_DN3252_c0_g1_i5.p1 TRINITY_DN3252_c0_g1~~TRINITY_DN3252_c0_g1_i5.p1  ORF type:complete len:150 (-),score=35.77 TRINITY_DN3252_c0_g1_i5:269-718(-)